MQRRQALLLLLNLLVTVGLLCWLGWAGLSTEPAAVGERFHHQAHAQLAEVRSNLDSQVAGIEQHLLSVTSIADLGVESMRQLCRTQPLVRQAFVMDARGHLLYPVKKHPLTNGEKSFLERSGALWDAFGLPAATADDGPGTSVNPLHGASLVAQAAVKDGGWLTHAWEDGVQILFWKRNAQGGITGVEVERVALLAQLVGGLPPGSEHAQLSLADAMGNAIYKWGVHDVSTDARPLVTMRLNPPLDAWLLTYTPSVAQSALMEDLKLFGQWKMLGLSAVVALVLLAIVALLTLSIRKAMREASQRVNFVTQVSHELKTPLTNIRLYAELLAQDIPEEDEASARKVGVIVAETERLTRLINNILTFSRHARGKLVLRSRPTDLNALVERVLQGFRPSLEQKGIAVTVEGGSPVTVNVDPDAVGQIVANLVNNVEKYAAGGKRLDVRVVPGDTFITLLVQDAGPGIPAHLRERVFEPFFRASDRLSDGVTGTGIGLTIARELARMHGGDLTLQDGSVGATFAVKLPTTREDDHEGAGGGG